MSSKKEEKEDKRKILILGSTNVGKSAICYHLGATNATSSDKPVGTTMEFEPYNVGLFKFVDTCGFNESKEGSVSADQAIRNFFNFISENKDGFHLAVLVHHNKKDSLFDSNYNLIKNLMPDIPLLICIQKVVNDWPEKLCDCNNINGEHFYKNHYPDCIDMIGVDLPGKDKMTDDEYLNDITKQKKKKIKNDANRLYTKIAGLSLKKYPITSDGIKNTIKLIINWIAKKVGKAAIYLTEAMEKNKKCVNSRWS